jgi:hypothetical protein
VLVAFAFHKRNEAAEPELHPEIPSEA